MTRLIFFVFSLMIGWRVFAGESFTELAFSPIAGVEAIVRVKGDAVELSIHGAFGDSKETIAVDTEKRLKITVEDYNFDGHPDFAISHVDDGMGTYQIYQVYVYSTKENKFVPLVPQCGDEFINLVVSKGARTLTNSYIVDNRYKTCKMKF